MTDRVLVFVFDRDEDSVLERSFCIVRVGSSDVEELVGTESDLPDRECVFVSLVGETDRESEPERVKSNEVVTVCCEIELVPEGVLVDTREREEVRVVGGVSRRVSDLDRVRGGTRLPEKVTVSSSDSITVTVPSV